MAGGGIVHLVAGSFVVLFICWGLAFTAVWAKSFEPAHVFEAMPAGAASALVAVFMVGAMTGDAVVGREAPPEFGTEVGP